jgi:hypothetical protein
MVFCVSGPDLFGPLQKQPLDRLEAEQFTGHLWAFREALYPALPPGQSVAGKFDPATRALTGLLHSLIESCTVRPVTRLDQQG